MKQTLFRDGVIERLPQLIGEGDSTFSVQASELENFRRVCKCLLGNSSKGAVMAGLNVGITTSSISVAAGYGISRGGDLIYISKQWQLDISDSFSDGDIVHVYLDYKSVDRGDSAGAYPDTTPYAGGGHSSWVNRENISLPIIRDGVGAYDNDATDVPSLCPISYNKDSGGGLSMTDARLYLGSALYSGGNFVFTPMTVGNEHVEYVFSHQFSAAVFTTTADTSQLSVFAGHSRILLPSGRKRLKSLNILRLSPSTQPTPRTTADVLVHLTPYGRRNGGGDAGLGAEAIVMQDNPSANYYETFAPGLVMGDDVAWLELVASCTAPAFTTNTDTNTNGIYVVEYIIEKLN